MRILVAEDDAVSRKLLTVLLAKWGYEVVAVQDGREAWETLDSPDPPRLAILDWMMPEMDGVEVCRRLREREGTPYVYTILLTAKSEKTEVIFALRNGVDDYMSKPFDITELRARMIAGERILSLQDGLLHAQDDLRVQATHDALTGLPNRLLFGDRLAQALSDSRRTGRGLCVMYLDVDRFKQVNDTFGHGVGDVLIRDVAERVRSCLRAGDTIARVGGDEFTLLLPDVSSARDAVAVSDHVMESFADPFVIESLELVVTASIGLSLWPTDGDDAESLVKHADTAMYRSKDDGRNRYSIYDESLGSEVRDRLALEADLHRAVERVELDVYYQPQVDLRSGGVDGVEALIRWRHPERGFVSPPRLIAIAEETGLIWDVSQWVLETACSQTKAWVDSGFGDIGVAVNVSPRLLDRDGLVEIVKLALDTTGLDPRLLTLELTETSIMRDPDAALRALSALREIGVRAAIDDFGTGCSSLIYLKRLPIDVVKIDRTFISNITEDVRDAEITRAVISLAHVLHLTAVAEGVETLGQLQALQGFDCDLMQGYFVSPAVCASEMTEFLSRRQELRAA
jgi:diguanylate cyclase (GGDEF)-like protein